MGMILFLVSDWHINSDRILLNRNIRSPELILNRGKLAITRNCIACSNPKMLLIPILLALGLSFTLVSANTPIDNSVFTSDPLTAIKAAAPLWHFDTKTCFPTSAVQPDGSQTHNLTNDDCGIFNGGLSSGCPVQARQTQQEQLSTPFPTYYTIRKCDKDASWRIVYDVFFQKVGFL